MKANNNLTYIVDLNDVDDDGLLTISLDFTEQYGPFRTVFPATPVAMGSRVTVVSDADNVEFQAIVVEQTSPLEFSVRVDRDSRKTRTRTAELHWTHPMQVTTTAESSVGNPKVSASNVSNAYG